MFDVKGSPLPLYRAIRKYGLWNFDFSILCYCDPVVGTCRSLEQLYLNLHCPAYNILTQAGTSTGYKHSEQSKNMILSKITGSLHPQYGVTSSLAKRQAISSALSAYSKANGHHNTGKTGLDAPQYGINGKSV